VRRRADGQLGGVEAVADKDLTTSLLARELGADALLLLTDVSQVEVDHGNDHARLIGRTTPSYLRNRTFPPGSTGHKVDAGCLFVEATGHRAVIGRLEDTVEMLVESRGTVVDPDPEWRTYSRHEN
jgi:carbamate kinase